eukprot:3160059-Rhodomonas_salina.3
MDRRSSTDVRDKDGDTPLHNAVKGGREEAVKRLLELGADAELANEKGNAPALDLETSIVSRFAAANARAELDSRPGTC